MVPHTQNRFNSSLAVPPASKGRSVPMSADNLESSGLFFRPNPQVPDTSCAKLPVRELVSPVAMSDEVAATAIDAGRDNELIYDDVRRLECSMLVIPSDAEPSGDGVSGFEKSADSPGGDTEGSSNSLRAVVAVALAIAKDDADVEPIGGKRPENLDALDNLDPLDPGRNGEDG